MTATVSCMDNPPSNSDNPPVPSIGFAMKFLFDLFPVFLFFLTFKLAGRAPESVAAWLGRLTGGEWVAPAQAPILLATGVVILATLGQVAWVRLRHGKVDKMLWFSLVLVVLLGGLTLALRDENFIKWKPTILYWGFVVAMAVSTLGFGKNALKTMLSAQLTLPEPVWARLNLSWIVFFLLMGGLNLLVAFHFSTDTWVSFKLFGGMGLMLLFVVIQGLFLAKYLEEPPGKPGAPEEKP